MNFTWNNSDYHNLDMRIFFFTNSIYIIYSMYVNIVTIMFCLVYTCFH